MFYECEVSDTEKHVYDIKSYTGAPGTDAVVSKSQSRSDKLLLNYFFEAHLRKKKNTAWRFDWLWTSLWWVYFSHMYQGKLETKRIKSNY